MTIAIPNPTVLSPYNTGLTQGQMLDLMRQGTHLDAFGRGRVSEVTTVFDTQAQYGLGPRDWSGLVVGAGAITHLPNESAVQLSTGSGTAGDSAIRQTRLCWRYQPGKGQQVLMTFVFGAAVANVRRRIGYFDTNDGVYLEQTTGSLRFVQRTSTSGAPSDALFVDQADWNLDKLDGTGPSGKTLDITKAQLLFMDLQWLGVGRVRVGFFLDGLPFVAHEFNNGNVLTVPYMKTANLPLRYEIVNTGAAAGATTMKAICASVMSEGGDESFQRGNLNSAANGTTPIAVTARQPVLSVRPAANFGGISNRAWYILIEALLRVTSNDVFWEVVFGGTLTGPVWGVAAADSCVEFDVTATAIAGGTSVVKGYALAGVGVASGQTVASVAGRFPNSVDSLNGVQAAHTIVATSMGGAANVAAAALWREIY